MVYALGNIVCDTPFIHRTSLSAYRRLLCHLRWPFA